MKYDENRVATWTRTMHAACSFAGSRSQPKIHRPRKVDSRKKASSPLDRERRAEHVADEAGVVAPVHAELELLHDPGHDADGEVDQEELAEELRQAQQRSLPVRSQAISYPRDDRGQADRDRDEEEVVDGRDGELPPRDVGRVHELLAWVGG